MTRPTKLGFRRNLCRWIPSEQLVESRRRWESNPLDAALQAAATPCDISVNQSVSLPGVEPGLRPSQSRVHPPHSKDKMVFLCLNARLTLDDKTFFIAH